MTRTAVIEKGERQLQFRINQLEKEDTLSGKKEIAQKAFASLDMLFIILDEDYDRYDYWFDQIYDYL